MSYFRIWVDDDEVMRALRRLENGPDAHFELKAAAHLNNLFLEAKAITHIETGKLKGSEHPKFEFDRAEWKGEVIFGGPEADYAEFELARGDVHDFLAPMRKDDADRGFKDAIDDWMRREG